MTHWPGIAAERGYDLPKRAARRPANRQAQRGPADASGPQPADGPTDPPPARPPPRPTDSDPPRHRPPRPPSARPGAPRPSRCGSLTLAVRCRTMPDARPGPVAPPTDRPTTGAAGLPGVRAVTSNVRSQKKSTFPGRGHAPVESSQPALCRRYVPYDLLQSSSGRGKDPLTRPDSGDPRLPRPVGYRSSFPPCACPLQQPARREYASCRLVLSA